MMIPMKNFRHPSVIVRLIYALCLLGAGYNHALYILEYGLFFDYGGTTLLTSVFWTSLTFLDPLAAVFLFAKARIGVVLTAAIIATDVLHNTWALFYYAVAPGYDYLAQVLFLFFVAFTAKIAWQTQVAPTGN